MVGSAHLHKPDALVFVQLRRMQSSVEFFTGAFLDLQALINILCTNTFAWHKMYSYEVSSLAIPATGRVAEAADQAVTRGSAAPAGGHRHFRCRLLPATTPAPNRSWCVLVVSVLRFG